MDNVLARKLELFGPLPDEDRRLLADIAARTRVVETQQALIREGDRRHGTHGVLKGFAYRYKTLPNRKRHIFAYLLPGDLVDPTAALLKTMDHGIATFSPCTIVDIPQSRLAEIFARPALARALGLASLVDTAILREWLVNIGARDAETRIAHLMCELYTRLSLVGQAAEGRCELPVTQAEIGDTMSLSAVHVNRSLKTLRTGSLVVFSRGHLVIPDFGKLRTMSGFDPSYLHLAGDP